MTTAAPAPTLKKEKTAAKLRYLNKKKIRRKANQAAAPKKKKRRVEPGEQDAKVSGGGDRGISSSSSNSDSSDSSESSSSDSSDSDRDEKIEKPEKPEISENPEIPNIPEISQEIPQQPPQLPLLSFPEPQNLNVASTEDLKKLGLPDVFANEISIDANQSFPSTQAHTLGLGGRLSNRLIQIGFESLFAVQLAAIPLLIGDMNDGIRHPLYPAESPRDICVSAPTGSGKTLGYTLPIVEVLSRRIVTRLRALIVLPTRDLVSQVRETFELFAKGTDLKIGTITGQQSFQQEQAKLVGQTDTMLVNLITTPGRLIDHINSTPNFTVQHLRFLVIDEADRLMNQSFQSWIDRVQIALTTPIKIPPRTDAHDALGGTNKHDLMETFERPQRGVQKMLFSATLTTDPSKIRSLHLNDPKFVVVRNEKVEDYAIPSTLEERMIVSETAYKPLMLLHLLYQRGVKRALCFTKSVESATRLMHLLRLFNDQVGNGPTVASFSSDLSPQERQKMLTKFKDGEVDMLVSTDVIARGIDVQGIENVINYDIPLDMPKYVHRVGRTARAGLVGTAWTLVEVQEAKYFKGYTKNAKHQVKKVRPTTKEVEPLMEAYDVALTTTMDFNFSNYSIEDHAQPPTSYDGYDPLSISPGEGATEAEVKVEAEDIQQPLQYKYNKHRGSVPSLSSAFSSFTVDQQSPVTPSGYFGHPFASLSNANRHSISVVAPSDTFIKPANVIPPLPPQHEQQEQHLQQVHHPAQVSRHNDQEDKKLSARIVITLKNFLNAPHRMNFGEQIISITTPQTAQKSYGNEKRFIAPPPQVCLIGKNWNSDINNKKSGQSHALGQLSPSVEVKLGNSREAHHCDLKWTEFQSHPAQASQVTQATQTGNMPLTPPSSSPNSSKSDSHDDTSDISDNNSNNRMMHGKAVAKHLHISEVSDDRRITNCNAQVIIPSLLSSNPFKGSFSLPNMNIISKASKQRKPKRNEDICVFHGSLVSLYNRAKSQTSSTRYLTVTGTPAVWPLGSDYQINNEEGIDLRNATFTPDANYWDPFIIWMYDTEYAQDRLPNVPSDWPTPPVGALPTGMYTTAIRANSVVVLQSLAHGVVSPPLIVRRGGKGSSVTGGGNVEQQRRRSSLDSNANQHRQVGCIKGSVLGEPTVQLNKVGLELAAQTQTPSQTDGNDLEASGMYLTCVDELIRLITPPKAHEGPVEFPHKNQNSNSNYKYNQEGASKSRRTSYQSDMHDMYEESGADVSYKPRSRRTSVRRSSISNESGGRNKRRSSHYDANNLDAFAEDGMTWSLDVGEIALWTLSCAEVHNHHIYTPEFTPGANLPLDTLNKRTNLDGAIAIAIPYLDSWVHCDVRTKRRYSGEEIEGEMVDIVKVIGKNFDVFSNDTADIYLGGKIRKARGVGLGLDLGEEGKTSMHDEEVAVWRSAYVNYISNEELIVGLPNLRDIDGELVDNSLTLIAVLKQNGCIIPSCVTVTI
ncbi:hypothetical protein E3P98_01587 [Wallemia ichthyophaga]|nr:hypothetical protein E3P98_01587 [Wallemia ichthyophaga]